MPFHDSDADASTTGKGTAPARRTRSLSNSLVAGARTKAYVAARSTLRKAAAVRWSIEIAGVPEATWFEEPGWDYQWRLDRDVVVCGECGSALYEFRHPYISGGRFYRHWAIVCRRCALAWPRNAIAPAKRRAVDQASTQRRAAHLTGNPNYLYVVALDENGEQSFYVGQSSLPPEQRFQQHLTGVKSSPWVRKFGVALVPPIYEPFNPLLQHQARYLEAAVADTLEAMGERVRGGH